MCAVLYARVGHGRPRTLPHHHGLVLPRRARGHPRYAHFLSLHTHPNLTRSAPAFPSSSPSSPATRFIWAWVAIRCSLRRVKSRVVRGAPALAGGARELRPTRSRQNRRREQARQGKEGIDSPLLSPFFPLASLCLITRDPRSRNTPARCRRQKRRRSRAARGVSLSRRLPRPPWA